MRPLRQFLIVLLSLALTTVAATADEWTAARLRGVVFQLVNGAWQQVHRNDVVPDGNVIRTVANGYADFTRGAETVSVGPQTEIVISDKGGAKPFTTVRQDFGTVTVDAQVENVQHFAVETPYLAAVVKGTKFVVTSGPEGASIKVLRGHVECDDKLNKLTALLAVGQSATVTADGTYNTSGVVTRPGTMTLSGTGSLPDIVDAAGNVVDGVTGKVVGDAGGVANGLVNGVANGLKGLTGKDDNNGNGSGNGNSGDGNSGDGNSGDGNSGNGNGNSGNGNSNGHGLLGLNLRFGYPLGVGDTVPGLWI